MESDVEETRLRDALRVQATTPEERSALARARQAVAGGGFTRSSHRPTIRWTRLVAGLGVLAVLMAFAALNLFLAAKRHSSVPATSPAPAASPAPSAAPPIVAVSPSSGADTPCRSENLRLAFIRIVGASGDEVGTLQLTNGGPGCSITGYPDIRLLAPNGDPLPSTVRRGANTALSARLSGPQPVILASGSAAYVVIEWVNGGPNPCIYPDQVAVIPPDNSVPQTVPARAGGTGMRVCESGQLWVYPIQANQP